MLISFIKFRAEWKILYIYLKAIVFTWSRSSTILPSMIGHTLAVYSGKEHLPILISDQMVGYVCLIY
jgi:ribosomal protein S19